MAAFFCIAKAQDFRPDGAIARSHIHRSAPHCLRYGQGAKFNTNARCPCRAGIHCHNELLMGGAMTDARIQFPVTCPDCRREALLTRPMETVAAALITKTKPLILYAPCHARHWAASPEELEQIREYLGAWLIVTTTGMDLNNRVQPS
jgi:hypothetical protein